MPYFDQERIFVVRRERGSGYIAVKFLVVCSFLFLLLQQIYPSIVFYLGLNPYRLFRNGWVWQLVTYQFLHGGFLHLLFNMFLLWFLGRRLEELWGSYEFFRYYIICGAGAGLISALVSPALTIGASGAIYGILLAFGLTFPNEYLYLYFVFPVRAKNLVVVFAIIEFVLSITSPGDNIAHSAHLAGMVVGFIYLRLKEIFDTARGRKRVRRFAQQIENERIIGEELDRILEKIREFGFDSLTDREKRFLYEASEYYRNRASRGFDL